MLIFDGGFAVIALILWVVALAECITSDDALVRNLPKMMWFFLILITFDIGAILWFILGRPQRARRDLPYKGNQGTAPAPPPRARGRAPMGPDDDPAYLESLRGDKLQSWEDDLLRRERELKRREQGDESGA